MQRLIICLLLCLTQKGYAQTNGNIDGLLQKLSVQKQDTTKLNLLLLIAEYYLDDNNDSSLYYNKQAEKLLDVWHADQYRHRCYHNFVKIYHAKFDYENSLAYCLKAIEVARENNDLFQQASSYRAVFNLYHNVRQNDSAVKYSVYALNLTEKIHDTNSLATNYGNLCRLYNDLGQLPKAVEFGKKGIEAGEKYADKKGLLISMNNLGNCYLQLNDNPNAIALFKKLLVLGKQIKRKRSVQNALINLGVIYFTDANQQELQKIVEGFKETEADANKDDQSNVAWRHTIYGYNYLLQNQFEKAEVELMKAKEVVDANTNEQNDALAAVYVALSKLKFATHHYPQGNQYEAKWDSLQQANHAQELSAYGLDLETKYKTVAKEERIQLQQSQLQSKTRLNYSFAVAILLVVIISMVSYRSYKNKQKLQQQRITELETEKQLAATEAVLKGEEKERTRIAKDLHDGLGGMLSGTKYSLNAMKGNLILTPENAQAFERSIEMLDSSIQEMRRVAHNMMPEALVKFGLDIALKDFCNDINQSGVLKVTYQSIGVTNEQIEQTTAITIYRIVQELVNNSIKHAKATNVIVQVAKTNLVLSITIEDDGKGFDTNILQQSKGIGWSNMQNRVEFLKGKLDINSSDKGTSILIEINT